VPTPFATLETRLGARTAALLADATLTVGAISVDGTLDVALGEPSMGMSTVQSKRVQFICPAADIAAAALGEDDLVTVTKNSVATQYQLALPPQTEGFGQAVLDLKRASL
jgi:hypothetical protein